MKDRNRNRNVTQNGVNFKPRQGNPDYVGGRGVFFIPYIYKVSLFLSHSKELRPLWILLRFSLRLG